MRSGPFDQARPKKAAIDAPGEVLIDLGAALIAFGTALQLAAARLQANQSQPPVSPQAPTPATNASVIGGLPAEGYVRIWDIIGRRPAEGSTAIPGMVPVSRATWYSGVRSGRFPRPIKLGGIAMWRVEDIRALVAELSYSNPGH